MLAGLCQTLDWTALSHCSMLGIWAKWCPKLLPILSDLPPHRTADDPVLSKCLRDAFSLCQTIAKSDCISTCFRYTHRGMGTNDKCRISKKYNPASDHGGGFIIVDSLNERIRFCYD